MITFTVHSLKSLLILGHQPPPPPPPTLHDNVVLVLSEYLPNIKIVFTETVGICTSVKSNFPICALFNGDEYMGKGCKRSDFTLA